MLIDAEWARIAEESASNPAGRASHEATAYVIYTSGSTGQPKGVQIGHQALVNYICWARDAYVETGRLNFALYSSLAFDLTVTSIYVPLVTGNQIIIHNWEGREAPLAKILNDPQAGVLKLTPSHLSLIKDQDHHQSAVSRLIVGGEALDEKLAREVTEGFGGRVEIFNEYGPTEATVGCMLYRYDSKVDRRSHVPIGRPAANTQIYVLDRWLNPTPANVCGELYIAGDALAQGYLKRPELTGASFVPDPFRPNARMYKTGDLARRLPNGELEFIGRRDEQVKFHGYRVELNEIQTALNEHPQIRESMVLLQPDQNRNPVMVAYYVSRQEMEAGVLREFLSERIIEETIPNVFAHLRRMPLTLNGKINREALPTLEEIRQKMTRTYSAPQTPTEIGVASIWGDVLGLAQVGVDDNFFELGGHSLLATQIISRLRQTFGLELPLRAVFENPTVRQLAERLAGALAEAIPSTAWPIQPVARTEALPLSFAQQRLWFLAQFEGGSEAYHIKGGLRLSGELDRGALRRALDRIVARHETLRTTFRQVDGHPMQVIGPVESGFQLRERDLRGEADAEGELERLADQEAREAFDLERGPLIRGRLARLGEEEHALLVTMHHIVSDGWSIGILINELNALYRTYCEGGEAALPDLPIQYADYAIWQRRWLQGAELETQLAYWRRQLNGELSVLALPTDKTRPDQQTHRGAEVSLLLPSTLLESLKALSLELNCTLFMTLLAAFDILIYYLTGQPNICVGTDIANRNRAEIENLIGFFVNQLVLRAELSPDSTFEELLGEVRETTLGAYAHQDLPFEKLVEALNQKRDSNRHPLFQVKMVYQNAQAEDLRLTGLTISPIAFTTGAAKLDLLLDLRDAEKGLKATLQYNTDLFEERPPQRIISRFHTLLDRIVERPGARLRELVEALVAEDERQQLDQRDKLEDARLKKLTSVRRRAASKPGSKAKS